MLEAKGIGIIRHQLVIGDIIAKIDPSDFGSGQSGTVPAVCQLVVIDIGDISNLLIIDIGRVISVIDGNEGGRVLHVDQVILVRAVVNGDIILTVVLVVVKIILGVIILVKLRVIIIISGIIVIPGLEVRAVGVIIVIGGVLVQKVGQFDIRRIIIGVIGGVMDGIEGFVVAVNDIHIGSITAPVIIGDVAVFILDAAGWSSVVILGLVGGIIIIRI